jgi:hypothetical protein
LFFGPIAGAMLAAACGGPSTGIGFGNGSSGNGSSGNGSSGNASGAGSSGSSGSSGISSGSSTSSGGFGEEDGGDASSGGHFGTTDAAVVGPRSPDAACAAVSSKGQQSPLDIYIMLDQSASMLDPVAGGQSKWQAVTAALETFVMTPQTGVSVGLQYFGLPPGTMRGGSCTPRAHCNTDADCGGAPNFCAPAFGCFCGGFGGDSCNAADYAIPDVEIAPLPGVGARISASIGNHMPTTSTPTSAALQGATQHASDWAKAHPGHVVIALLATDGDPTECDTTIPDIEAIASMAAAATPKILTFVIGVGSSTMNLNGIAAAGGTGQAFIVDTTMNVNQQFLNALNAIRGTALGCSYTIPLPASGTPDFGSVNVQFTPSGSMPILIPKVSDKSHCPPSGNAWYYDSNMAPTQIILCDATCKTVTGDKNGEVDVLLGCATRVM